MLKTVVSSLIIFAFISVAVFGILTVSHGISHGLCLLTANFGSKPPCPEKDPLGFVNFHINIFKSFSSATFANSLAIILSILLAWTISLFLARVVFAYEKLFVRLHELTEDPPEKSAKRKFISWLSLRENSPNLIKTPIN